MKITEAPFDSPRKLTDTPSEQGDHETGGLRGIFGKRRKTVLEPEKTAARAHVEPHLQPLAQYATHVALASDLVNKLLERLEQEDGFKSAYPSEDGLERIWNEQLMRFPRADLVTVRGDRLEAVRFNRFVEVAGSGADALTGLAEDTMGALAALCRTLRGLAKDSLGERAEGIVADLAQPFLERGAAAWPADFKARSWAVHWMD